MWPFRLEVAGARRAVCGGDRRGEIRPGFARLQRRVEPFGEGRDAGQRFARSPARSVFGERPAVIG